MTDLQYAYSEEVLRILRPLLFEDNKNDEATILWPEIRSQLTSPEVKHDVALCLLAEVALESKEVDITLDACGAGVCLVASSRILTDLGGSSPASSSNLVTALPLALRTIRRHYLTIKKDGESLASTFQATDKQDDEIMSQLLLRLPVLISNACLAQKLQLPSWAVRTNYLTRLVQCSTSISLFRRMVQVGASDAVAQGMAEKGDALICWTAIPTKRDRLKLLQSIVRLKLQQQSPSSGNWRVVCETEVLPYLSTTCLPPLNSSASLARQFSKTLLLSNPTAGTARSNRILAHTIALILKMCRRPDDSDSDSSDDDDDAASVLQRAVQDMVTTWTERRFVQQASPLTQRRVTYFLQSALPLLETLSTSSQISQALIRGVSVRLESSIGDVRIDGMRIAQLLAQQLGGDVHFDELDDEEELQEEEPIVKEEENPAAATTTTPKQPRRRRYRDPDAEYQSSDSEEDDDVNDDDSLEWDDDLVPLGQGDDDEEDLRETPKPVYLRECLELLQTPESHQLAASRHATSLEFLPKLVQSRPFDLPDVAAPLAQQLLRMEDKFGMDDFEDSVRAGLVALAVNESSSVGDVVIGYIFDDVSLHSRMLGLYTLESAARELSGAHVLLEGRQSLRDVLLDDKVSGNRRLVPGNDTKTRRWGRLKHPDQRTAVVNRFTAIAPRWFYSLVGNFMDRKDDAKLWGGANGARLLSHLLVALANIVESCGGATVLSRDLMDFCWTFRTSEDATLRSAVLVAVASSLATCDATTLVHILHGVDLPDFLATVIQSDPDDVCRKLAKSISRNVLQVLNQQNGNILL